MYPHWDPGDKEKEGGWKAKNDSFPLQLESHFKHFSATTELSLAWKRQEAIVI